MSAPSTSALLLEWDRRRPRSSQAEFGMSEVGGCRRRAGYRLHGVKPTNAGGSVQAVLGTSAHQVMNEIVADLGEPGVLTEAEVRYAGIVGHLDRYHADCKTVVDLKTTSSRWLEHIQIHGPDVAHLWQVSLYAAALISQGKQVERVRIDYIARDTGREWQWPGEEGARFDPRHVRDALQWIALVRDTDLDMLPRDYDPDSGWCRGCPFFDKCWEGHVVDRDPRSVLYVEDPDAQKWARQLRESRDEIKRQQKIEAEAKGALDAIRPDDGGRVQCGDYTIDFRQHAKSGKWGVYFVAGANDIPAVGFQEGDG